MLMRHSLVIVFLWLTFASQAADFRIEISGTFHGAEGNTIRLMEYGDLITFRELEISSTVIDSAGNFVLSFERFEPRYVFLRIDHAKMGLFVEPGKAYALQFDPVDFALLDDTRNPYLDPWYFGFKTEGSGAFLNSHMDAFEDLLNDFLLENFARIHSSRNRQIFDEFRQKADSVFGDIDNDYFRNYYEYKFAYYYRVANLERFQEQMRNHLLNRPVLYHNIQYMNFFNTVFDTYIFAGSRNISLWDLRYTINELNSYHALMDSLGKDTLLRNEVVRELVMLKGLQDVHGNPDYRKSNVEHILGWVANNSKFHEHRNIAENILFTKKYLQNQEPSPAITVYDKDQRLVNIPDDFKGKFLLLGFWATWCESCLLEFIAMDELYKKYSDNFEFISISTDRNKNIYEAFLKSTGYPWLNYHFGKDFRILDAYQIRNLPTFVLIGEDGQIIDFPARRPSEGLVTHFEWLLFQKRNQGR